MYINDLQENLNSNVRLFADDTIAYLTIKTKDRGKLLQEDKLARWEELWCMKFHPDKCNVLHVTHRRNPIETSYNLHGHTLEAVTSAKYIGVSILNNLKWDSHITNISDKANRTLGSLIRNLRVSSRKTKSQAYFGLVRPQLQYMQLRHGTHIHSAISTGSNRYRDELLDMSPVGTETPPASQICSTPCNGNPWNNVGKRPDCVCSTR